MTLHLNFQSFLAIAYSSSPSPFVTGSSRRGGHVQTLASVPQPFQANLHNIEREKPMPTNLHGLQWVPCLSPWREKNIPASIEKENLIRETERK